VKKVKLMRLNLTKLMPEKARLRKMPLSSISLAYKTFLH
jgi:hypothetical protein